MSELVSIPPGLGKPDTPLPRLSVLSLPVSSPCAHATLTFSASDAAFACAISRPSMTTPSARRARASPRLEAAGLELDLEVLGAVLRFLPGLGLGLGSREREDGEVASPLTMV